MTAASAALRRLADLARRAGGGLLDAIYPPACLVCRRAIAEQGGLCPACWREIAFIERPFCERLGVPFDRDLGQPGLISLEAAAHPPVFARARAVARFDSDGARALAYRLKYRDRLELAEPIGRWMTRAGAELLAEADLLAPVPLHRRRLIARQFNQSAALAKVIAAEEIPERGRIPPSIQKHCDELGAADGIVVVHPNWWGQPPAILKGWIDRVIRPGRAYRFQEGDGGEGVPVGLLRARAAVVLNTSNTEAARERTVFGDPLEAIWRRCIFDLCGVPAFHRRTFTAVVASTSERRRAWIEEAQALCRHAFGPAAVVPPAHHLT